MNWTATISYRDWEYKETICGPIISVAYYLRKNAELISSVELLPQHPESPV